VHTKKITTFKQPSHPRIRHQLKKKQMKNKIHLQQNKNHHTLNKINTRTRFQQNNQHASNKIIYIYTIKKHNYITNKK
jgi:hypothetical protein